MKTKNNQRGLTVIGFLLILIAVGFIALMSVRIIPVYLNAFKVAQIAKRIQGDRDLIKGGIPAIQKTIERRMNIEQVSVVTMKDVKVEKTDYGYKATIAFEDRFPLVGNMDGICSFEWSAEFRR